jgi:glucose/arabinose dehydrogenase
MSGGRNRVCGVTVLTLVLLSGVVDRARAGTPAAGFADVAAVTGLSAPTATAFLPDGRMIITEQGGTLKLFDGTTTTPVVDIPVCAGGETGLLGIAVDPAFASNGYLYLYRTESAGDCGSATGRSNEVIRVTMGPGNTVALASLVVIKTGFRTDNGNHNGGCLRLGPDGKLYVAVGDTGLGDNQGGPGSSTNPYASDLNALEGKVLRLELDGSVPADNPFVGQIGKRPEIFASGFRNPWRFGFDPMSGRLWLGDVGDATVEEIDIVTAGGAYGWPNCEGTLPTMCEQPGDIPPIYTYQHNGGSAAITGGAFALGGTLAGEYFFGDSSLSTIWQASPTGTRDGITGAPVPVISDADGPVDIVFGPDGALYYAAINVGQIRRVTSAGFSTPPPTTTTTTTLPPGTCTRAPSFACVDAELAALVDAITALGDLGGFEGGLGARAARALARERGAAALAAEGKIRAAKTALVGSATSLGGLVRRLHSRAARRRIATDRKALAASARQAAMDVRALLATL